MITKRNSRLLMLAAAGVATSAAVSTPAQAGLFEFLFGAAPTYSQPPAYRAPLDIRVNPSRVRKPVARSKPEIVRARVLAKPIDPVKHPDWYLEDPTLRRGDIVVLKGRVLVFEGGHRNVSPADFASLSRSRLLSKSERDRIAKMADTTGGEVSVSTKAEAEPTQLSVTSPVREVSLISSQ